MLFVFLNLVLCMIIVLFFSLMHSYCEQLVNSVVVLYFHFYATRVSAQQYARFSTVTTVNASTLFPSNIKITFLL